MHITTQDILPTGKAPFEIVYGKLLPTPTTRLSNTIEAAHQFVVDFESIYSQVREVLVKTQTQYTKQANKHRKHMIFNEGDFVMLRIEKRRLKSVETNPVVKLAPRFYGPFKIMAKINDLTYRLDLPPHWQIHNTFHKRSYGVRRVHA